MDYPRKFDVIVVGGGHAGTEAALASAKSLSIGGKDLTPFLLKSISHATGGDSLAANRALVAQNAIVGAAIALAFSQID